ncbi:MAG: nuclear transport factor 2 family protein [Solirubrobacterales bacterium]
MSDENVEIVRRALAANRSGPPEETREIALSLVDPAVEFRSRITAVEGADYLGPEGLRKYFDDMADAFRVWRNDADEIVEVGPDAVLVDSIFHAVGKDSGLQIELRNAALFVLSEGKIVRCLAYPTREEALEAAGLSE